MCDTGSWRIAGSDGLPGRTGPPGSPGQVRADSYEEQTGSVFAFHSQDVRVPDCPLNLVKLWDGYSLLYLEGNVHPLLRRFDIV